MIITLVLVSSINGMLTNGSDPNIYSWTSSEDHKHFFSLIEKHELIIMGRKTYEAAKDKIKLHPDKRRVVLTSRPESFSSIPRQLECSIEKPRELIGRLQQVGYSRALLVGGGILAGEFLKDNLINTIYLTIEPKLFAAGAHISSLANFEKRLVCSSVKQLNPQGTLLVEYTVER